MSTSAIYLFNSAGRIPYYKNGKRLFFKGDEINKWIFSAKINTAHDIEGKATAYIRKNSRKY